ncbi:DUF3892 domain-containing protein [Undibacterium sp.]|uniref:DUF3892 domain-containing protein n=1 Tax=Undibacterium sp. TaxID=1914977 RepID=UPI00272FD376|nr:DUF3892 domain-containing protein [Undibacterium sp.]MDP1976266.1 DUF3892 domain-containing protein [Undibacterium sp.]
MLLSIQLAGVRMSTGGLLGSLPQTFEHIESVTDGLTWWTVQEVIDLIGKGVFFYVKDSFGNVARVDVVNSGNPAQRSFIKTHADGKISDNLLALPGGPLYRSGLLGKFTSSNSGAF